VIVFSRGAKFSKKKKKMSKRRCLLFFLADMRHYFIILACKFFLMLAAYPREPLLFKSQRANKSDSYFFSLLF
jgi:hypothetical protein